MIDLVPLTTDNDMRVKASDHCQVIQVRSQTLLYHSFYSFCILFYMLYGYLIGHISNAKIGPLFYFTLTVDFFATYHSLYFVNCRRTKMVVRHTQFLGFVKNILYIYNIYTL